MFVFVSISLFKIVWCWDAIFIIHHDIAAQHVQIQCLPNPAPLQLWPVVIYDFGGQWTLVNFNVNKTSHKLKIIKCKILIQIWCKLVAPIFICIKTVLRLLCHMNEIFGMLLIEIYQWHCFSYVTLWYPLPDWFIGTIMV